MVNTFHAKGKAWKGGKMEGENWMNIRSDWQKGLSYTEIGKKYHIHPRTAKKYAESESKPVYKLYGPKRGKLDAYKGQIDQLVEEAPYSAVRVHEQIKGQGYKGGLTVVRDDVRD